MADAFAEALAAEVARILIPKMEAVVAKALREMAATKPKDELWGAEQVGEYLKVTPRHVTEVLRVLPGFPACYRLPSGGENGGRGRPKWMAAEIRAWVEKHKGK